MTLDEGGVSVRNHQKDEQALRLSWKDLYRVYRRKRCVYLYAAANRAFLLPAGQADRTDAELWAFLTAHMDPKKVFAGKA